MCICSGAVHPGFGDGDRDGDWEDVSKSMSISLASFWTGIRVTFNIVEDNDRLRSDTGDFEALRRSDIDLRPIELDRDELLTVVRMSCVFVSITVSLPSSLHSLTDSVWLLEFA